MPEPGGTAKLVGEIVPGVYHFTIHDDRIDFQSDSYAVIEKGKAVLIDPLPMAKKDLKELGPVEAICLTGSCHERSAWRYRRVLKVLVYAPQGGVDFEEPPDRWYKAGDRLPGNLLAVHTPGPTEAHYSFFLERNGGAVFCADLLTIAGGEGLAFVSGEYQDEPARTRASVRHLLNLGFRALCPDHGDPVTVGAKEAVTLALERDKKQKRKKK
jgi:glyoxylase-like metal-dependent hydrolase (beta-lactamase superfamily II)